MRLEVALGTWIRRCGRKDVGGKKPGNYSSGWEG